ncbi:MAG: hypothetical protein ABI036_17745 [Fibrobacteria bacterium]
MKTPISIFKILLTLGLCLFSLIDSRSVTGWVVCLGEDGHIALESSPDGDCCLPLDSPISQSQFMAAAVEDHCGGCRDIPVDGPTLDASLSSKTFSVPSINAAVYAAPHEQYVSDLASSRLTFPTAPARGELALIPIRSTVLRI